MQSFNHCLNRFQKHPKMSESRENVETDVPSENHQIVDSQNCTGTSLSESTRDLDENSSQDGDVRLFEGENTGNGFTKIKRDHDENSGKDISGFDCVDDKKTNARKKNERSVWFLLKRDKIYRKKYILTIAYILSFLTLVSFQTIHFWIPALFVNSNRI